MYCVLLAVTCPGFAGVMFPNTLCGCSGLLPVQNTLGIHAVLKTILHKNRTGQKKKNKRTGDNRKHSASWSFSRIQMSQNGLWSFHTHHPVHSPAVPTAPPLSSRSSQVLAGIPPTCLYGCVLCIRFPHSKEHFHVNIHPRRLCTLTKHTIEDQLLKHQFMQSNITSLSTQQSVPCHICEQLHGWVGFIGLIRCYKFAHAFDVIKWHTMQANAVSRVLNVRHSWIPTLEIVIIAFPSGV